MTNNSPFDEQIKEKFSHYSPDVPPHIWENIIAQKEKRRPGGLLLYFLNKNLLILLFVTITTTSGILVYKNFTLSSTKNKVYEVNERANRIAKTSADKETKNNNVINSTIDNNNNKTIAENNTLTKIFTSTEKNILSKGKGQPAVHTDKNLLITSAGNNKNNSTHTTITDQNTSAFSNNKKQKKIKGSAAMAYINPGVETDDPTDVYSSEKYTNDILFNRFLLNPDLILAGRLNNLSIKKINPLQLDIPCPEAEKNAAGNKRYFELYGGPDYAFRSMTDTGNSAYLQRRKESTRFSTAFSAGLRYTRVFGNGMSFRTGVNYSQINEKFKFAEGNIIQVVYIINGNGDTTGNYTTTGTRYKTTFNKFRTIDIPVLVGYELGNGRWHANFNAGVVINAYSWQKGDVLDTAFKPISITTGKTTSPYQFKTNVGIGFMGAVSVYYKLTDRWHIFAEPYFRYSLSPASKAELTLKQKYNTLGLRLGVRLDF